jgi:hypothetical protein
MADRYALRRFGPLVHRGIPSSTYIDPNPATSYALGLYEILALILEETLLSKIEDCDHVADLPSNLNPQDPESSLKVPEPKYMEVLRLAKSLRLVQKDWGTVIDRTPRLRRILHRAVFVTSPTCYPMKNGIQINSLLFSRGIDHHHPGCPLVYGLFPRKRLLHFLGYALVAKHMRTTTLPQIMEPYFM